VEVAYPLRPLPVGRASRLPADLSEEGGITQRVVIPEASLWEPESPFLYEGPVELWQDGRRCDQVTVCHGIRSVSFGPQGLRLNGRPLVLSGRVVGHVPEEADSRELHRAGCNLLVASVDVVPGDLWGRADRLGFFVLGRVAEGSEGTLSRLATLAEHASCLGWLVPPGADFLGRLPPGGLVGVESARRQAGGEAGVSLPEAVHFVAGAAEDAVALAGLGRPLLLEGPGEATTGAGPVVLGAVKKRMKEEG
jgi:hypothetical protein